MNAKQIEVHDYYKALHPKALILYHIPGQYIILGDDVNRALKSLSTLRVLESGVASCQIVYHLCLCLGKMALKYASSITKMNKEYLNCQI